MTSFADNLITQLTQVENEQERKRAAFRYANASLALEGFASDRVQLARQEDIIQGRLATEEAIVQLSAEYGN